MAKKNNKGFSLVEIIIAIAVLTLLITPVVNQLAQTVKVNRKSKLQQYVNDSASKFLEDIKSADINELDTKYGVTAPTPVVCQIVDATGTYTGETLTYSAKKYTDSNVTLGPDRVDYSRTAILDDLPYVAESKGSDSGKQFKIKYGCTEADLTAHPGFELSDDGSMVKYDADGYITSVVCEPITYSVSNPNEINVGNMTDIDTSRVAVIPGTASNFDREAEAKYYGMAMEYLKKNDPSSWNQALLHTENDNVLNHVDYVNSLKKMTKVYIDEITMDGKKAYEVSASVYYYSSAIYFAEAPLVSYDVYYQVFKMDECPNVYFEYQPFTIDVEGTNVSYAAQDFIVIENYVDDAKVYLYKPVNDEMKKIASRGDDATYGKNSASFYTSSNAAITTKVGVKIFGANAGSLNKPFKVYTNINLDDIETTVDSNFPNEFKTPATRKASYTSCSAVDVEKNTTVFPLKEDGGRITNFYNVRVSYVSTKDSGYKVLLTGAKGDN